MGLAAPLHALLLDALEEAYPDPRMFDGFLRTHWNKDLQAFAPSDFARPEKYAEVITRIHAEGEIIRFLEALRTERKNNAKVQLCWQRFTTNTGSSTGNPFQACVLSQFLPFWNRTKLRDSVRGLLTGFGKRTLVVDGLPRSGRSFTRLFISHVAPFHNADPYYLDMDKKRAFPPADVARLIGTSFKWDLKTIPEKHAQETQWVEELGEWIAGNAREAKKTVVLIFDNSNCPGLYPKTKELLIYLTGKAVDNDRLRVVLLAYNELLQDQAHQLADYDPIQLPTKTDFHAFLAGFCQFKGYGVSASDLAKLVDEIWNPLVKDGPIRLDELVNVAQLAMESVAKVASP
jgi:hypothetical protein